MKAPDKIYVCVTTPPIALACSEVPWVNKENNFEYIRKDALLEWLRKTEDGALNEIPMLDVLTLQKVIDKLNSL